uniref:Uncharacterized protein n=1 Tax=Arundo donax TaxID=35708 RepID=A0A0A9C0Q8_ARUDO
MKNCSQRFSQGRGSLPSYVGSDSLW